MENALGQVQSALVLGGGSDIALAIVERLVSGGARRVVLAARRPEELAPVVAGLQDRGVDAEAIAFDARDLTAHGGQLDEVFDRGDIDVVIQAFGVLGAEGTPEDEDPAAAAELVVTNFAGAVSSGLAAARRLREQGHGALVVISSVAGERPRRSNFLYGSSKAGLDFFARGLAEALRGSGARLLIVRPGFVQTKMTAGMGPRPFATTPERVAEEVVRGLQRRAGVVWSPPIVRWVFLALRLLPAPLFRLVMRRAA